MIKQIINELYLKESGLSRLLQHNENHDCAIITAFRNTENCDNGEPITRKENQKRNLILAKALTNLGYQITKVIGWYMEGNTKVTEVSYFVVNIDDKPLEEFEKDIIKLGEKFEQVSVLIIPKGAMKKGNTYYISTNNCENNWVGSKGTKLKVGKSGKVKFGKIGDDFATMINGRPFVFESLNDIIFGSMSNAVMASKFLKEFEEKYGKII